MNITNYELEKKYSKLERLSATDKELPALVAYKIVSAVTTMGAALVPYAKVREKLIKRYSGGGDTLTRADNPDAYNACIKELDEIGNQTIEIDLPRICLSDLSDARFTLAEMDALTLLIGDKEG